MKKKILIPIIVGASALVVAAAIAIPTAIVLNSKESSSSSSAAISLTLDKTIEVVEQGDSFSLKASVTGSSAEPTWTSSDDQIATYSGGFVHGVGVGECYITASVGSISASCRVIVTAKDNGVYSIATDSTFHVEKGSDYAIESAVHCLKDGVDNVVDLAVSYSSSDEHVFKVEDGKIKPVAHGRASLTLTTEKVEKIVPVVVYDSFVESPDDFLAMLGDRTIGNTYFLTSDLDFSGLNYALPSLAFSKEDSDTFKGSFEGYGHTIKNIEIACEDGDSCSLLGNLNGAAIKDVNFVNVKFKNAAKAFALSGFAGFLGGIDTVIENVSLDVSFDLTNVDAVQSRSVLFGSFENAVGIYESPYHAQINNVLATVSFPSTSLSDLGFQASCSADGNEFQNVYVYSGLAMTNPAKTMHVSSNFDETVYEIVSNKALGESWEYPLKEMKFPLVKEGAETLSDIALDPMDEPSVLSNYEIVADYPFTVGYLGQAYGDYGADISEKTNQLLVNWHALGGANTNPMVDISLSEHDSFLFFLRSNESDGTAYLTMKNAAGDGQANTSSYDPVVGKTWVSVEMDKQSDGKWCIKVDGSTVEKDYDYTNLNEFDFCFSQRRYFVSELFANK